MDLSRVVVLGGGLSGLAAAWSLLDQEPGLEVIVWEAASRLGGKLIRWSQEGFLAEGGADGFLIGKGTTARWIRDLGLEAELVAPIEENRGSQVFWNGDLHPLPEGLSGLVPSDPQGWFTTTALSAEGAARAARERQVPGGASAQESVEAFLSRRFGTEAFERILDPLLAGIFAGDATALSASEAFPQLVQLEQSRGYLTPDTPSPRAPSGFRSFSGGMARLTEALETGLRKRGCRLETGKMASAVIPRGPGYLVSDGRTSESADAVLVALPPRTAAPVLGPSAPLAACVLEQWPTASVANLTLAFSPGAIPALPPGSGFVAPPAGGTDFSAATWLSQKWPHRSPPGGRLVRFYFGGARRPDAWKLSEEHMLNQALDFLGRAGGAPVPSPLWHRVFRWRDGFAQPNLGHKDRHDQLKNALPPKISLAGGYFGGVGIPDCLGRAEQAASELINQLKEKK